VPLPTNAFGLTVIADDINNTLQISRHGVFHNISRPSFPGRCHALLGHHRLFTNRAAIIEAGEFAKAVRVNGVTAWQILRRLAGSEHIFAADWTIILVLVLEAVAVKF
jgi:hypothetical protein